MSNNSLKIGPGKAFEKSKCWLAAKEVLLPLRKEMVEVGESVY